MCSKLLLVLQATTPDIDDIAHLADRIETLTDRLEFF